ncbi:hypothetical protein DENIS_4880 [Desulfonema ishimotonii]|uniref:AMIN domain-containing protein n=2 Tax=Desulfonema ishimotonii TaxID=45657 RepID=A0A401G3W9_9BACT|nr:hypothetical protein DENIS_4880 [Desulfonema ishimotonii]
MRLLFLILIALPAKAQDTATETAGPAPRYHLEMVAVKKVSGNEEKIYFMFDGPRPPRTFFTETGPLRVVSVFSDTRPGRDVAMLDEADGRLVQTVRVGRHDEDGPDVWVVLDLVPGLEYELEHIFMEGKIYLLIVKKR